jgi:hypothetical protein
LCLGVQLHTSKLKSIWMVFLLQICQKQSGSNLMQFCSL